MGLGWGGRLAGLDIKEDFLWVMRSVKGGVKGVGEPCFGGSGGRERMS